MGNQSGGGYGTPTMGTNTSGTTTTGTTTTTASGVDTDAILAALMNQQQQSNGWQAWYGGESGVLAPGNVGLVSEASHNANFYAFWANAQLRARLVTYGAKLGIDKTDKMNLQKMWNMAGQESALLYQAGKKMTPMQVLAFYAGKGGGLGTGSGSGSGGSVSRSSSVSYDISDAKTAKAITNAVMNAALGRQATPEELEAYKAALNAYEKANPSRSSGVSRSDGSGNSTSSSTSYSGASAAGREQLLKDKADSTVEGQAYQTQDIFQKAMERLAGVMG